MYKIIDVTKHFWSKVNVESEDECWEWLGTLNGHGYGRFRFMGKDDRSHRVSWMLTYGEIPDKLFVLHKCDNPKCVNPNHLFLGTQLENMQDMTRKGRGKPFVGIGEKNPRAKLKKEDVLEIRNLYGTGKHTCGSLAKIYKVSNVQINWIVNKKSWKYL